MPARSRTGNNIVQSGSLRMSSGSDARIRVSRTTQYPEFFHLNCVQQQMPERSEGMSCSCQPDVGGPGSQRIKNQIRASNQGASFRLPSTSFFCPPSMPPKRNLSAVEELAELRAKLAAQQQQLNRKEQEIGKYSRNASEEVHSLVSDCRLS
jgi:hypothetical protein